MSKSSTILSITMIIALIALIYAYVEVNNNPPITNSIDNEKVACEQSYKELEGYNENIIECESIPRAYTNKGECCIPQ